MAKSLFVAAAALVGGALSEEPAAWKCAEYTHEDNAKCVENVEWAKSDGIAKFGKDNYPANPTTDADFQCALFLKKGVEDGPAWSCKLPPCAGMSEKFMENAEIKECLQPPAPKPREESAPEPPKPEGQPSFPWWAWPLTIGGVGLAGLLAYFLYPKPAPKMKKRAIKPLQSAPPPAEAPAPEPVQPVHTVMTTYTVAHPVVTAPPVLTAPPIYTAAPVMAAPAPVHHSVSIAPPVVTAPPVMAAPVATVAAPAPVSTLAAPLPMAQAVPTFAAPMGSVLR
eukprot:TRINITY_DN827_c0_g1_i1.p1 TRINITY_DN827_c0_g1~~TRINITY_DN827_c0_g1_i1.p1  ORF type:complete len:298 (+),score=58.92 TRINITY_DN827_c0_g1_i1:54-896(+)